MQQQQSSTWCLIWLCNARFISERSCLRGKRLSFQNDQRQGKLGLVFMFHHLVLSFIAVFHPPSCSSANIFTDFKIPTNPSLSWVSLQRFPQSKNIHPPVSPSPHLFCNSIVEAVGSRSERWCFGRGPQWANLPLSLCRYYPFSFTGPQYFRLKLKTTDRFSTIFLKVTFRLLWTNYWSKKNITFYRMVKFF